MKQVLALVALIMMTIVYSKLGVAKQKNTNPPKVLF